MEFLMSQPSTPTLFFSSLYFQTPPPITQAETMGSSRPRPLHHASPWSWLPLGSAACHQSLISGVLAVWCPPSPQQLPLAHPLCFTSTLQPEWCFRPDAALFAFVPFWTIHSFPFICPEMVSSLTIPSLLLGRKLLLVKHHTCLIHHWIHTACYIVGA